MLRDLVKVYLGSNKYFCFYSSVFAFCFVSVIVATQEIVKEESKKDC